MPAMEHALTCNNLKCRKELRDRALVTTCSHIFCLECVHRLGLASQESPRGTTCPACNSQLSKPDDAVITNLNPSEDYKTSVLSGLSPNVIMECAGRALSFWAYQITQEIYYQQYLYKTLADKYSNLTVRLDQTASEANAEIERLQHKLNSFAAEQESMRRKNEELAQAYRDKSRKLLQTQELYDKVKRKAEMGQIQRAASDAVDSTLHAAPLSQSAAHEFDGYRPDRELGYRNTFSLFGQGSRFEAAGINAGIPRSNVHHAGFRDRWPTHGAAPQTRYGVVIDAGSTGSRIYVHEWENAAQAVKHASAADLRSLPRLTLKRSSKIHPGVSSLADRPASVGPDHLKPLLDVARHEVPAALAPETPIFVMATAGVRFLPRDKQTALLRAICSYLQANTEFDLPDCESHVQVIPGEIEGLYGWIAANYLLGGFDRPDKHAHGKGHHTYGFLDMGGASAQIAFAPNATEAARHADDLKLVRMRRLDGSPVEYRVFTATWLGFGANKARSRYVDSLQDTYGASADEIPDPCMPRGLRTTLAGQPVAADEAAHGQVLVGTGAFAECLRKTYPLLGKDAPCEDDPCLLNGQHAPAIDFDVNHFVGVSEYWHTTHGVFGKGHKAYDLATYQHVVMDFCNRDWSAIAADLDRRKKALDKIADDAREACFKASWLINVLHDGIGIPRVGLDGVPSTGINATRGAAAKAEDGGFLDPFQPVDKIDGVEVSWTLGKMVLYAAGQIPPKGPTSLSVGFGSNVESGTPSDFEHAGSNPLLATPGSDDKDDEPIALSKSMSGGLWALILLAVLLVAMLLCRPERRRRLLNLIGRRRRSSPGRKPPRGRATFVSKLLGRGSAAYERIMEEGEAAEMELGDMDSDDRDCSDSSEGPLVGNAPGTPTPKLNVDRFDDLPPPSAMDRNGLVIRTESRERLAPALQMLNAGRRSRTGSPTRLKSPLMTPLED